jgi:hypothetical protein
MSKQTRYLLTVDSATGAAVKLERLGEAGDLTEVPLSTLAVAPLAVPGPRSGVGAGAQPSPQSLVINIYMGGPQQAAPLSVTPGLIVPGPAPGSLMGPGAPGAPGQVSLFSIAEARAPSTQSEDPVGPASVGGPGGGSKGPGGETSR